MERIRSLDLARGFTVLFIPAIHSVMVYSKPEVYTTWLGYPLQFIAEGPGAQVFMVLMGMVFTFKITHTAKSIGIKALALLLAGYLLNILKFIIPYAFGVLPLTVLSELQVTQSGNVPMQLLQTGDILHFAAIALIILYAIHQLKNYAAWAIGISILVIFLSPLVWDIHTSYAWLNYPLQLFTGQPPQVFFPVFPWMVYPLIGLAIGSAMRRPYYPIFTELLQTGLVLILAGWSITIFMDDSYRTSFYRTWPWDTLWHIGIVLLTLCIWNWISAKFTKNYFFDLLCYCSRNITQLYIIQWVLICWLLPIFGYQQLTLTHSVVAAMLTSALTFSLSLLLDRFRSI